MVRQVLYNETKRLVMQRFKDLVFKLTAISQKQNDPLILTLSHYILP